MHSKHQNVIKSFKRNFARETDFYSKNSSLGNYFSEDETRQTKNDLTSTPASKYNKIYKPNLREQIETYIMKQPEYKKRYKSNLHLEIEFERKKRHEYLD